MFYLKCIFTSGIDMGPTNHCYIVAALNTIYLRTPQCVMGSMKEIIIKNHNKVLQINLGNMDENY